MAWEIGEQQSSVRRKASERAALNAEWDIPEGRIGGLIRQQRQRAATARAQAGLLLKVLITVIALGILFYIVVPYLKQYLDGRRLTLLETKAALETTLASLDADRDTLRDELVIALADTIEVLAGDWSDSVQFGGAAPAGDGALLVWGSNIFDDEGTLLRYDIATGTAAPLSGTWSGSVEFLGAIPAGDGALLVWGTEGTLLRYDIAAGTTTPLTGDWPSYLEFVGAASAGNGALLIWGNVGGLGDPGTLLRYDFAAGTVTPLTGGWSRFLKFLGITSVDNGALLIWGNQGTLLTYPGPLLDTVRAADLVSDGDLLDFIDTLPRSVLDLPEVDRIRRAVSDLIGQRKPVIEQLAQTKADIDGLWTGISPLNQQRESFAAFMVICRGYDPDLPDVQPPADGLATDPDAVTLACTEAWQARLDAEQGNWWQALAQQVPPGILLLFLLATLGGPYRYNLRLAGFHHSRADLLELISMGREADAKFTNEELAQAAQLADSLAADKVEFGKGNTPSDEAVELARAITSARAG